MKLGVFTTTNYLQIGESIIINIMVFVMNNLIKIKFSAKVFFHNMTVLSYILTFSSISVLFFNPQKSVSEIVLMISTCPMTIKSTLSSTFERAKSYFMSSSTMQSFTWFFTVLAWGSWYESGHIYTIDAEHYIVN